MFKSAFRSVVPVLKPMVTKGLYSLKDAALTHDKEFVQNVIIDKQNPQTSLLQTDACVVWKPDTAGEDKYNDTALTADDDSYNVGFNDRPKKILQGRTLELFDRLHLDMWFQETYLLNGVDIRLRLNSSSTAFHLMAHAKTKPLSKTLHARHVEVLLKVGNDISHTLSRTTAKYPIRCMEVNTFTFTTEVGLRSKIEVHLFQGQLSKRLFIGIISNAALNSSHNENPLQLKHCRVSKIEVSHDGKTLCTRPFEPNFTQKKHTRSYLSLYEATGQLGTNTSHGIYYDEYAGGYTLWAFDFTPYQGSDGGYFHSINLGNCVQNFSLQMLLPKL